MNLKRLLLIVPLLLVVLVGGVFAAMQVLQANLLAGYDAIEKEGGIRLEVVSPAFEEGQAIPKEYTCDGDNISLPLTWFNAPAETMSFAIVKDDPDTPRGGFVHWVAYNIPPEVDKLHDGIPAEENIYTGGLHGKNGVGSLGYTGACPPSGANNVHRYYIKVFALSKMLTLPAGATKDELYAAMKGNVLAHGKATGIYAR